MKKILNFIIKCPTLIKNFFVTHKISFAFTLIFLFIFILGGFYSRYMVNQIAVHEQENITFEITGYDYNFDLETVGTYPYLVHVNFGENQQATLYLTKSKLISGVQSGDDVPTSDLLDIQAAVSKANTGLDMNTYIQSYDADTHTVVIVTAAYASIISVSVVYNNDFTAVLSYLVTTSETYQGTAGHPTPYVENYYMDGYAQGNTNLDAIAGASEGTSPAMQDLVDILTLFVSAQTGGN
ncbi:MAG: hypothetical protein AB7U79_06260 [Candidatus Izemoplasmatales bacterium]